MPVTLCDLNSVLYKSRCCAGWLRHTIAPRQVLLPELSAQQQQLPRRALELRQRWPPPQMVPPQRPPQVRFKGPHLAALVLPYEGPVAAIQTDKPTLTTNPLKFSSVCDRQSSSRSTLIRGVNPTFILSDHESNWNLSSNTLLSCLPHPRPRLEFIRQTRHSRPTPQSHAQVRSPYTGQHICSARPLHHLLSLRRGSGECAEGCTPQEHRCAWLSCCMSTNTQAPQ